MHLVAWRPPHREVLRFILLAINRSVWRYPFRNILSHVYIYICTVMCQWIKGVSTLVYLLECLALYQRYFTLNTLPALQCSLCFSRKGRTETFAFYVPTDDAWRKNKTSPSTTNMEREETEAVSQEKSEDGREDLLISISVCLIFYNNQILQ